MMNPRFPAFEALLLASVLFVASCGASAAVIVTCTGGKQLSTAIAKAMTTAKPGALIEFRVTGSCVDDLVIPLGVKIYLNGIGTAATGGYGASLQPATTSASALKAFGGWAQVDNFYIKGKLGSNAFDVVEVNASGFLQITNSKVVATGSQQGVGVFSTAQIANSVIVGEQGSAIMVAANGYLSIYADDGKTTTVSSTGAGTGNAIGCYLGAINAWTNRTGDGYAGSSGILTIGPAHHGIDARGCRAQLGLDSKEGSVRITANMVGVRAVGADIFNLKGVSVSDNTLTGMEVSAGVIEIDNSTISKPTSTAVGLSARRGGVIYFNNFVGPSRVAWTGANTNFYECRQGGHIYGETGNPTGGASTSGCLEIEP